jgi:hypothetical protein
MVALENLLGVVQLLCARHRQQGSCDFTLSGTGALLKCSVLTMKLHMYPIVLRVAGHGVCALDAGLQMQTRRVTKIPNSSSSSKSSSLSPSNATPPALTSICHDRLRKEHAELNLFASRRNRRISTRPREWKGRLKREGREKEHVRVREKEGK